MNISTNGVHNIHRPCGFFMVKILSNRSPFLTIFHEKKGSIFNNFDQKKTRQPMNISTNGVLNIHRLSCFFLVKILSNRSLFFTIFREKKLSIFYNFNQKKTRQPMNISTNGVLNIHRLSGFLLVKILSNRSLFFNIFYEKKRSIFNNFDQKKPNC